MNKIISFQKNIVILASLVFISCGQNNNKKNEMELSKVDLSKIDSAPEKNEDYPFETIEIDGQLWTKYNLNIEISEPKESLCLGCEELGRLYTFKGATEVDEMYKGWRIPTKAEAQRLINFFKGGTVEFIEKFNCLGGYSIPNTLPAGILDIENQMERSESSNSGGFWTSTVAEDGEEIFCVSAFLGEKSVRFEDLKKEYFVGLRLIKE